MDNIDTENKLDNQYKNYRIYYYQYVFGYSKEEAIKAAEEDAQKRADELIEDINKTAEENNHSDSILRNDPKYVQALEKTPKWIERGEKLIYPSKLADWIKCINIRIRDIYYGSELDDALRIMELLDKYPDIRVAVNAYNRLDGSGASVSMAAKIVFDFSKRGPEFYHYIMRGYLNENISQKIKDKEEENIKLNEMEENIKLMEETQKKR